MARFSDEQRKQRYILRALFDASREKRMHHTDREQLRALRDQYIEQQRKQELLNRGGRDPDGMRRHMLQKQRRMQTPGERYFQNPKTTPSDLDDADARPQN